MYKKSKTLISVIILGAVGSGFWEIFLKDLLFYILNFFVKNISLFYKGYVDSIYERVGIGSDFFQILPSILISVLILSFPFLTFFFIFSSLRKIDIKEIEECETKSKMEKDKMKLFFKFLLLKRYRLYLFFFFLTLPTTIVFLDLFIKETSTYLACKIIERNIQIVRPYIADKEYYILNSNSKQIDNKEKLISIFIELNNIKQKNNIKVEDNRLLGIDLK